MTRACDTRPPMHFRRHLRIFRPGTDIQANPTYIQRVNDRLYHQHSPKVQPLRPRRPCLGLFPSTSTRLGGRGH